MVHEKQEVADYNRGMWGVLLGMLLGALAGAIAMLLLAPQSGEDTRKQIQQKGNELRHQTAELVEDAVGQLRAEGNKIAKGGRHKAEEMLQQGQGMVAQQLERVSKAARAGKKAIESA